MKNIITSLLLTLSLAGPASVLAQETETEVQATETPAFEDQLSPVAPAEAPTIPDQEAAPANGELKKKSSQDLVNEIEDLTERLAAGDFAGAEREALKVRIRGLRDRIDSAESGTGAPWESNSIDSLGGMFVASLAIMLIFGTPIMLVAAVLYANYRKRRLMHNTIDQYVSSGRDIPPAVLESLHQQVTPGNNLHRGLVMTGVGLGVIACFLVMGAREAAALGLIPLFIGLAQLLIWKLEKKPAQ
jgi:hypothetical protein